MILQALHGLALREGLMTDPDFEPKPAAWLVRVSEKGKFLGIEGTHRAVQAFGKRKKPILIPKTFYLPREGGRTSGDRAFFLYDKAEYVFGLDPEKEEKKKRPKKKLESRFGLFRERAKHCLDNTGDEGVKAVYTLLEDLAAGRQRVKLPEDCKGNDLFAFIFAPDKDILVTEREKVRDFWKAERGKEISEAAQRLHCLVSGEPFSGVGLFPALKKVPGGTSSGVALVSFNTDAFESYGWRRNENAPISRDAAETCATALNRLLHPAYPDPHQQGQTLSRRNLLLSADTVVCYWAAEKSGDEFCSIFSGLLEADPSIVEEAYQSIWRGRRPLIEDASAFYALTITGSQGRAVVRDWFESTVTDVAKNLTRHFGDLDIVRNTPKPKDRDLPPQFRLRLLLESLAALGKRDEIPAHLAGQLIRAALSSTPYPFWILQRALERMRAEIGRDEWVDLERRDARVALIKAVLNRRKRFYPETTIYKEIQITMDPQNNSPGYLLGRLMATIERMQQLALGDVGASVVDRFFSGASATPAATFPRLLRNLRHHARKAKDETSTAGTAGWLEIQVDEIMKHLQSFPPHLDIEQQGLFVIGYHHQRNWLWTKKEDREN